MFLVLREEAEQVYWAPSLLWEFILQSHTGSQENFTLVTDSSTVPEDW